MTTKLPEETSEEYLAVPIVHLLKHPNWFKDFSVYILISDKYIRLNFSQDPYDEILINILKKGETQAFLKGQDFEELIQKFQAKMVNDYVPNFDEVVARELQISENETMIMLAQNFIKAHGLTPQILEMVENSNKNIQQIIKKSKNIVALLESYRLNCSEEYFKISFTNYICSLILNQFSWKTSAILDNLMLASTICDLSLNAEDLVELKTYEADKTKPSEKVRNHSDSVIELLKEDQGMLSLETITIIKQHHERPDGKGFPLGIDHRRINQLSAILIVSQRFAEMVCKEDISNTDYQKVAEILGKDLHGGFFSKTCQVLIAEISKIK
jgi:response regulator RpfG family c-di-GMP phosphodiesterase